MTKKNKQPQQEVIVREKGSHKRAAPTLTEVNAPSLKKRKLQLKKSLQSPYAITWPTIEQENQTEILELISRCLSTENLKKPRLTKGIKKIDRLQYMKDGWSEKTPAALNLRSQLTIGLSATMRLLERDELVAVLVDVATPQAINAHLLRLAAVKQQLAIGIRGISKTVAPLLGLDSVIALGIKKRKEDDVPLFDDLVDKLRPLTPNIVVPWDDFEYDIMNDEGHTVEEDKSAAAASDETIVTSSIKKEVVVKLIIKPVDFRHLYVMKCDLIIKESKDKFQDLGDYSFSKAEQQGAKFTTKDMSKSGYISVNLENRKYNPNRPKKYSKSNKSNT